LPAGAGVGNPVDMIASASAEQYQRCVELVAADTNIDALIVCFTPPLVTRAEDVGDALVSAIKKSEIEKPVLAVFLQAAAAPRTVRKAKIPAYKFPETAAIALARTARYAQWRKRPEPTMVHFEDLRRDEAAAIIASALQRGNTWLTAAETSALLSCYGLPLIEQAIGDTPEAAAGIAEEMGGEVALKVIAPGILHKTEAGGVRLHLRGADEVRAAASEMSNRLASSGNAATGFVVQRMADGGVEMLVGMVHDPQFGPVVACGAGGVKVELLRDVSVRLTPLSKEDAAEMVRSLKTYPLLDRFRGGPAYDVAALEDALLRVSAMVEDLPQIAELDCNPFVVQESAAVILDARVRVEPVEPKPLLGVRK
jgi:acyl-CoA synthetase (NDP forming)